MRAKWYKIPTILESLAEDVRNGATWHEIATELYHAGWMNYIDEQRAKRLVGRYLHTPNQGVRL